MMTASPLARWTSSRRWLRLPLEGGAVAVLAASAWQVSAGRPGALGLALAGGCALALDALLTSHPTLGFHAPVIVGAGPAPAGPPRLALTFDDGPVEETAELAARLARRGVPATFFLIGQQVRQRPDVVRQLVLAGHEVGCHSHGHAAGLSLFGRRAVTRDLEAALEALEAAGAPRPRYYRAPAGVVSPPLARAVTGAGLELVAWTARGLDGVGRPAPERVLARLAPGLRDGSILVLHDRAALGVVDPLLDRVEAAGLRPVTLSTLLGARQT